MKVVYKDILDASQNIIVHQVNCKGVMGAGLAKSIADKYPNAKDDYIRYCNNHTGSNSKDMLGMALASRVLNTSHKYICHIFAQDRYGRERGVTYTDYDALKEGLEHVKRVGMENDLSIAIPYGIGCGLAGGNWNIVLPMIEQVFDGSGLEVVLYRI